MGLHHDYDENSLFSESNFEDDPQELDHRKRVRKMIEARLERKRLKDEFKDELDDLDDEFDWDNLDQDL